MYKLRRRLFHTFGPSYGLALFGMFLTLVIVLAAAIIMANR